MPMWVVMRYISLKVMILVNGDGTGDDNDGAGDGNGGGGDTDIGGADGFYRVGMMISALL